MDATKLMVCALLLAGCGSERDPPKAWTGTHSSTAAEVAEITRNLDEMADAAAAHFDATGKFCETAWPRETDAAKLGDDTHGWVCLGWSPPSPTAVEYEYTSGSGYFSTGVTGAPDPGALGFEAFARDTADMMYTVAGSVDAGKVVVFALWTGPAP